MISYDDLRDKSQEEKLAIAGEFYDREEYAQAELTVSALLDVNPHERGAIALLGAIYQRLDHYGMSEMVFRYGVALFPDFPPMWLGLGTAIRDPFRSEEAIKIFNHALEISPKNTVALTNLAAMYVEIGEYDKALEIAKESMKLNPDSVSARDAVALASFGLEDFKTGWEHNKTSLGVKFRKEIVYGDEERWEGEKGKSVIIYGEQGIGDEIFYGSMIPDAIKDCKKVIIDCDPRLEGLFKRSFPKAYVYGTRGLAGSWMKNHKWDARIAAADLGSIYRNAKEDFKGEPFLKADPDRAAMWASLFGSRTKIGIGLRGGNKYTNRTSRCIPIETFRPLLEYGDLVSLEYSDFDYGKFPVESYAWATQSKDYDNVAALLSQLDYVVTTCTAVVHVAGGLGIPCFVLTPRYPGWRYAHDMPWYNSVHVIHCDGDFDEGMKEVVRLIELRKVA